MTLEEARLMVAEHEHYEAVRAAMMSGEQSAWDYAASCATKVENLRKSAAEECENADIEKITADEVTE
jgi:hypothetical protein